MKLSTKSFTIAIAFFVISIIAVCWYTTDPTTFMSNKGFMPHGHCYLWTPSLLWTMVLTDALIGLAYLSISICLYFLVRRIRLPFSAMFLAFGAFIGACGATHFMSIYTLWIPNYWLDALVKLVTASASVATAVLMIPLFPRVVEFAMAARLSEERKRQLEEMNRQLQQRTEALEIANRELEAFSYSVSHDLRTPLRGIDGFSQALLEDCGDQLDAQGKVYLEHVRESAQRMGRIIDDLLNLSRITRTELAHRNLNLTQLAKDALQHLQKQSPDRKIEIVLQEEMMAMGDPGLLRIVLENLLSNSWKFTSKVNNPRLEFGSTTQDGRTTYFVRDNGVGFDMQFSDKLFRAFQRLHSQEEYLGTGVGLATAKRIIERHGGQIWAESMKNQGTTFFFNLGGQDGKA